MTALRVGTFSPPVVLDVAASAGELAAVGLTVTAPTPPCGPGSPACPPTWTRRLARQVAFAYATLTSACHYHPYELAPTAAELTSWITDVEALAGELC